jgi:hypothetical protein
MADTKLTANASQLPAPAQAGAAEEEEVYSTLGALLGTLEVVQADDDHRLAPVQLERLRGAIGFVRRMQHQVEALLILAGSDLDARLRRTSVRVAPLIEHAVRSAKRGCDEQSVTVQMIARDRWADARVYLDGSRVDRALGALVEALAGSVGRGGAIDVTLELVSGWVVVELVGHPRGAAAASERGVEPADVAHLASGLLARGCERLFALQGGELSVDPLRPSLRLMLPTSEAT